LKLQRLSEKKHSVLQGYTLIKAEDLCQHPKLFEKYFEPLEVIEEQEPMESNDVSIVSDGMDFQSLFATAIKLRRKNKKQEKVVKPKITYELRFQYDDDETIRKLTE
jgi:hypothetical protein